MNTAIIAGIDSGLGHSIAEHLLQKDWRILGTTRRHDSSREIISDKLETLFFCDFSDNNSIDRCAARLIATAGDWEILVLAIGVLDPIGDFRSLDFNEWERSFQVNFLGQMRFIQTLIAEGNPTGNRLVLTFAGGGTNSATTNFSSYTLAKIALIKGMELLAKEIPDSKFVSLGTGWMNTPIHLQTIRANALAGASYLETLRRIEGQEFGKEEDLLDFLDWCWTQEKDVVSGRNFSLQTDPWREPSLTPELLADRDMYKLRRHKNLATSGDEE